MPKFLKMGMKFMSAHPEFNATIHALGGIGIGALITYPIAGAHPVRFALIFIALALIGHTWAMTHKP